MSLKPLLALCAAAGLLTACETYTEKTSPCLKRSGETQVSRAALSFSTNGGVDPSGTKSDCSFTPLPRPR
ncbi:MAG: hypothetical protein VR71_11415 [Roseovarius sp. BRH_c41]|uniref:hypothetical protein n=1 Tax=Roseovarius sp. BRH_c41 TaxID=1629709 RepID=UPI0005F1B8C8|nr:hypothetical protein [Roseovarius sp. BRH_c41]KJS43075.1 MAG: hypothetical protein VR71_11415 [Roseovarius sp. BRH_c41]